MFEDREGWLWPAGETGLWGHKHSLDTVEQEVYPRLSRFRTCVQAGGAAGMWAKKLAERFDSVYTFEPNPLLFKCLTANTQECLNVWSYCAALGYERGCVNVDHPEKPLNMGAYYVHEGGKTPTLKIDDLALENVDLIFLDIEGYELFALQGAVDTLQKWSPVVVVEWHENQFERYGYKRNAITNFLKVFGYEPRPLRNGRDQLFLRV